MKRRDQAEGAWSKRRGRGLHTHTHTQSAHGETPTTIWGWGGASTERGGREGIWGVPGGIWGVPGGFWGGPKYLNPPPLTGGIWESQSDEI